MKTVVVTGAYGFIGRYVAACYKKKGWRVVGLGHGIWERKEWTKWGIDQWHECDITIDNLRIYCEKPDVIVHCAGSGSVGFSVDHPMQDFERTVRTTQYILEFVRLYMPETKIVYPSSAAVYGIVDKLPISEDSYLNPISPYGVHKKIAEELCLLYAKQYHLSIAIVRLFSVYGIGLRKQLLWDACNKIEMEESCFFGTGLETRDWVHVQDVAELLYLTHKKTDSPTAIINGGSGVAISVKEILSILFTAFGSQKMPQFLGKENIGNPSHYQADVRHAYRYGWEPKKNLQKGIAEFVGWYKEGAM